MHFQNQLGVMGEGKGEARPGSLGGSTFDALSRPKVRSTMWWERSSCDRSARVERAELTGPNRDSRGRWRRSARHHLSQRDKFHQFHHDLAYAIAAAKP